ncbi:UbiA prenyltransferase family-domain-containing protein [Geopyxis carbonaria]|nr:UbiA prenyltransferase family-domain-containing protein [Geopyxis carbonaria]
MSSATLSGSLGHPTEFDHKRRRSINYVEWAKLTWELARFHTRESWLECFPAVWGICLSAGRHEVSLSPLQLLHFIATNWLTMSLIHGSFCILNDIIDLPIDRKVERTKNRPLPSGRISPTQAFISFVLMSSGTALITYRTMGFLALQWTLPIYAIFGVYPFTKRFVQWPQFVLAPAVAWPAFVGWVSLAGHSATVRDCIPLFLAVCVWTIYFDTCYGTQDSRDDKKIGVGSLAVFLGDNVKVFLGLLGVAIISLFAYTAKMSNLSPIFWVAGLGVWGLSFPMQLKMLDLNNPKSGGKVFQFNIMLGMYITAVSLVELAWSTTKIVM